MEEKHKDAVEFIDLGLPSGTKWATCNIGANTPEDFGDYLSYDKAIEDFKDSLPSIEQWQELMDNCKWKWTGDGHTAVGKNGNSIFLPVAGYRYDAYLCFVGSDGSFWSSSLNTRGPYGVNFHSKGVYRGYGDCYYGRSVRLISK